MKKRDFILVGVTALIMCIPLAIVASKNQQLAEMQSAAFNWNNIKASTTKTGERRNFFDAKTKTLDQLECHVSTLNPGETAHPPHQHPEEEMTIVKDGIIEVMVNGEFKRVGPGSVVFQASNQPHTTKNTGTTAATYFAIRWRELKK